MIDILMTNIVAHRENKPQFFFSRFNFERMRQRGATHFCFACITKSGFRVDETGTAIDFHEDDARMAEGHSEAHAEYVVGNANQYKDVWSWLDAEIPPNFPYIVTVPSVP